MTLPFSLPGWMPPWLGVVLLIVGLLYVLALLAMPFAVFGVKSRLEAIEDQLEQVQEELRVLTLRLPEPLRGVSIDEAPYDPFPRAGAGAGGYEREAARRVPPIPPMPEQDPYRESYREPGSEQTGRDQPARDQTGRGRGGRGVPPRRIEPRLD